MYADVEATHQAPTLGSVILNNPVAFQLIVIVAIGITFFSIWKNFRHSQIVFPVGILFIFILADRAISAGFEPLFRMMSGIGM